MPLLTGSEKQTGSRSEIPTMNDFPCGTEKAQEALFLCGLFVWIRNGARCLSEASNLAAEARKALGLSSE